MLKAGVSNTELAARCDVSVQAVGQWLRHGKVARQRLPQIAEALGTTIDELLGYRPAGEYDELDELNEAWPELPEYVRQAICKLAGLGTPEPPEPPDPPRNARKRRNRR